MSDTNLINVIIADHEAFRAVFTELEADTMSPQHRRDLVDHLIAELVRHAVAEEQFVYPVVRERIPDGDSIVDHEIEEHSEAELVMKELDGMDVSDARFEPKVRELMHDIRHHLEEEETKLLPRVAALYSTDELDQMGENMLFAKQSAPTHPHPSAPDTPPGNLIVQPGLGLVDRMRDVLSGRKT